MNRRSFLQLLAAGAIGSTFDYDLDKLLWIPGQKTIFIPKGISESQIVAAELERILPHIRNLFERDSIFYQVLDSGKVQVAGSNLTIPLHVKPGEYEPRYVDQVGEVSQPQSKRTRS